IAVAMFVYMHPADDLAFPVHEHRHRDHQRQHDAQDVDQRPQDLVDELISHDAQALLRVMVAPYGGSVAVRSWADSIHAAPSGTAASIRSGSKVSPMRTCSPSAKPSRDASRAFRRTAATRFSGCALSAVALRSTASP